MSKDKPTKKKLKLNKRPVRRLSEDELGDARGGLLTFNATGDCIDPVPLQPPPVANTDTCATGACYTNTCRLNFTRANHNQALRAR